MLRFWNHEVLGDPGEPNF
ncbi:MAG: hypothetical protein ACREU8_07290 [Gammaproteobacteria bacterium]